MDARTEIATARVGMLPAGAVADRYARKADGFSRGEHLLFPILRRYAVKQVCLANIFPLTPEVSARHDGP